MEPDISKSITKLITKGSTSGSSNVDSKLVKDLIHYAGKSETYLKFTHERLLKQLKKNHSQIRLGVLLIINEFFKKSSFYRELFLDDFRTIIDLTVGSDKSKLPPPADVADKLKLRTLEFFQKWAKKYSSTHHRIPIAYNYIKNVLKIDFGDSLKRNLDELARAERDQEREEKTKTTALEKLQEEIAEHEADVLALVTEMKNCFCLIIPKPEEFLGDAEASKDCDKDSKELDIREHGLTAQTTISIEFNPNSKATVVQTEDNEALIETIKGLYTGAKSRYYPLLRKWTTLASKSGKQDVLNKVVTLKDMLCSEMTRFEELHLTPSSVVQIADTMADDDSDCDSDDNDSDFEEVPDKVGYEEFAIAPPVIPKPAQVTENQSLEKKVSLASAAAGSSKASVSYSISQLSQPIHMEEFHDPTYGVSPSELKAEVTTQKSTPKISNSVKNTVLANKKDDRKSKLLAIAPKLPFDVDLYHWEDKDLKAPVIEIADTGMHRFWQPIDREGEAIENPDGVSAFRTRNIEFVGTFEPVQWSCRAPLPSGKLCPRKDREKCPFHGNIIARDESGNPTKEEDIVRIAEEKRKAEQNKVPDWQDPKFLKELQAEIGIDLTIRPSKKGGKSFAEKYPKLADLSRLKDDPRSRLEKKVFSKQSLKRVADAMDSLNKKRFKDKFGDQYNYTYD